MEIKKIAKTGKILNNTLMASTLIMWIGIYISNFMMEIDTMLGTLIYFGLGIIYLIATIVALVFSIMTFSKMGKVNLKGGALLLASAIAAIVTAAMVLIIGFMVGLVVIVLSGLSNKQIADSEKRLAFESQLGNTL